jgi:hypothetical protein
VSEQNSERNNEKETQVTEASTASTEAAQQTTESTRSQDSRGLPMDEVVPGPLLRSIQKAGA